MVCLPGPFDPLQHIEMTMPYVVKEAGHGEAPQIEFINLPQSQTLGVIINTMWPLSGMAPLDPHKVIIELKYRSIKKKEQQSPISKNPTMKPMEGDRDEADAETRPFK